MNLEIRNVSTLTFRITSDSNEFHINRDTDRFLIKYIITDNIGYQIIQGDSWLEYDNEDSNLKSHFIVDIPASQCNDMTTISVCILSDLMNEFNFEIDISTLTTWKRKTILKLIN